MVSLKLVKILNDCSSLSALPPPSSYGLVMGGGVLRVLQHPGPKVLGDINLLQLGKSEAESALKARACPPVCRTLQLVFNASEGITRWRYPSVGLS